MIGPQTPSISLQTRFSGTDLGELTKSSVAWSGLVSGELDGIGMVVAGVPHFEVGQEAVLFVWTDPTGHHQVSGFEQGAVPIETDAATGSKTARRAMALGSAPAAGAVASDPSASYRLLPQLLDQIRASVAKSHQSQASD